MEASIVSAAGAAFAAAWLGWSLIRISKCWGTTASERVRELPGYESLPLGRSTTCRDSEATSTAWLRISPETGTTELFLGIPSLTQLTVLPHSLSAERLMGGRTSSVSHLAGK